MKSTSDSNSKKKERVVIAGAGCAGLAAGIALLKRGYDVTIFEKEDRVGGLAGGVNFNQNTYEYGPHIFHTTDPEILADVQDIAKSVLIPFHKTIKIKYLGKYFDFPLAMGDILIKLPFLTILEAVLSLAYHFIAGIFTKASYFDNAEKVLKKYYGDVLYRLFFKDYISKVWGMEPSQMSAKFAEQRIPRLNLLMFLQKISEFILPSKRKKVSTDNYVEKVEGVNYTTKKGFSLIAECFQEEFVKRGGAVILNEELEKVIVEKNRVTSIDVKSSNGRKHYACEHFISTIPICLLPEKIEARDIQLEEIRKSARQLKFRGIVFVGLLIKKAEVLPASFMYFRDKSFNRITDLAQFKMEIHPAGSTILVSEITCQPEDDYWVQTEKTIQTVIQELVDEKLLQPSDVLEAHVFKATYGYPIYSVGYEENLQKTLQGLSQVPNLHTIGRQGKFAYINTHIAMKMGYEAARKIANEKE